MDTSPDYSDKKICITGGTSFLGQHLVKHFLDHGCQYIRITSRDEVKQMRMKEQFNNDNRLRFILSDVRDLNTTQYTFRDIDIIIHAAALKRIDSLEYAPWQAVSTNVIGSKNVIDAAIRENVKQVIGISTDKASQPITTYGSSKLAAEKLFTQGNVYSKHNGTQFAVVRYGNVFGSTGSIFHIFKKQMDERKPLTITHPEMTRFFMEVQQSVELVEYALCNMKGNGEIFVPKCPSFKILDLASVFCDYYDTQETYINVGFRGIEKMHETLICQEEMMETIESSNHYIILPTLQVHEDMDTWKYPHQKWEYCKEYSSDTNKFWLNKDKLKSIVEKYLGVP